jgi:small basic protein (TIGR04137 family)
LSVHRSLATKSNLVRSRNVLNRYERIELLKKTGRFQEDASPYGLPKVRVLKVKKRGKEKKKKEEAAAAPAAAPAAKS